MPRFVEVGKFDVSRYQAFDCVSKSIVFSNGQGRTFDETAQISGILNSLILLTMLIYITFLSPLHLGRLRRQTLWYVLY